MIALCLLVTFGPVFCYSYSPNSALSGAKTPANNASYGFGQLPNAWADDQNLAEIELTNISPIVATSTDTVVIEGVVRNTSSQPLTNLQLHLWRSTTPITNYNQLNQVLSYDQNDPWGQRLYSTALGQVVKIPSDKNPVLAAGESATFRVSAKISGPDSLMLYRADSSYLVGVQLRGEDQSGNYKTLGRARTLLTVLSKNTRLKSTDFVLLSLNPTALSGASANQNNGYLTEQLNGELSRLVDYAIKTKSTVLLDPALWLAVKNLAESNSEDQKTPQYILATSWLAKLDRLISTGQVYRTQYGLADLSAVATSYPELLGFDSLSMTDADFADGKIDQLALVVVDFGNADEKTAGLIAEKLKPKAILTNAAQPGIWLSQNVPLLGISTDYLAGGPQPYPNNTSVNRVGRLRSTQLLNQPASGPATITLIDSDKDLPLLAESSSWVSQTNLANLLASVSSANTSATSWNSAANQIAKSDKWINTIAAAYRNLQSFNELSGGKQNLAEEAGLLLSTYSLKMRDDDQALTWLNQQMFTHPRLNKTDWVSAKVTSNFVVGEGKPKIPISLTNKLDQPVTVRLVFTSEYPTRIDIPDSAPITISAGETDTVVATPDVKGLATVDFKVEITTTSGQQIGESKKFTIQATSFGNLGWVLIIGSGAVLLAGTALRIRKVAKTRQLLPKPTAK